jgi:hypothetical protein
VRKDTKSNVIYYFPYSKHILENLSKTNNNIVMYYCTNILLHFLMSHNVLDSQYTKISQNLANFQVTAMLQTCVNRVYTIISYISMMMHLEGILGNFK